MLALKYLLMILGAGLFGSAGALVSYDIFLSAQLRRLLRRNTADKAGAEVGALAHRRPFRLVRWPLGALTGGRRPGDPDYGKRRDDSRSGGACVSQIWGAQPGTLYPGVHIVSPPVDSVAIFDTREQVYSTNVGPEAIAQKAIKRLGGFAHTESCATGFR